MLLLCKLFVALWKADLQVQEHFFVLILQTMLELKGKIVKDNYNYHTLENKEVLVFVTAAVIPPQTYVVFLSDFLQRVFVQKPADAKQNLEDCYAVIFLPVDPGAFVRCNRVIMLLI